LLAFAGLALCEVAVRISVVRADGQVMNDYFRRGQAGGLLRLYDRFAGGGVSTGTVAALGLMPYLSARIFIWIARLLIPAVDRMSWQVEGRIRLTRCTRGLTLVLALVQSCGFALFTESVPGAVAHPGAGYVVETMLIQTAVAMFVMWLSEQVMASNGVEPRAADPVR
jgi:preprotein translocase subunit SecY